jgi:hypothetical protein
MKMLVGGSAGAAKIKKLPITSNPLSTAEIALAVSAVAGKNTTAACDRSC